MENSITPEIKEKLNNYLEMIDSQDSVIVDAIVKEENPEKLKDLTQLYNNIQAKKNILRANKFNTLLDSLADIMINRITKTPDNFSNDDLAKWVKIVNDSLKLQDDINNVSPSVIYQQNTQINMPGQEALSRDSKENIMNAVQAFLNNLKNKDSVIPKNELAEQD